MEEKEKVCKKERKNKVKKVREKERDREPRQL
jgi:hypothetical protein